jgi:hypothetical protein
MTFKLPSNNAQEATHPRRLAIKRSLGHGSEMRSAAANGMGTNFVAVFADFPKLFLLLMS